jgi:alcohol dehydrogenase (NADP+)
MYNAKAYSAASATSPLASTTIARRDPTEHDVQIEILFCGICHSDLHQVRNEWSGVMPTVYPCVPGHEIVGRVTKVGSAVTKFKPGDLAAVGCMVDSDGTCPECQAGLEQFCPNLTLTYNFPDKHLGGVTYGGYSDSIVVDERFVLQRSFQPRSCRNRAAALRRNHHLLAHAPLGRHQRQERSAWSVSADWATWA